MKKQKKHCIIKPVGMKPKPDKHEERAAELVAEYFDSDVMFIPRKGSHTPDILLVDKQQLWEIKGVRGNSKNTINNLLKGITAQSENVVITLFRTTMKPEKAISGANRKLQVATRIKRVILITKSGKIIAIKL